MIFLVAILYLKRFKSFYIVLSLLVCVNIAYQTEEEVRDSKREIEVVMHQRAHSDVSELVLDSSVLPRVFTEISTTKFVQSKFIFPYKKERLFIFHCQLAFRAFLFRFI